MEICAKFQCEKLKQQQDRVFGRLRTRWPLARAFKRGWWRSNVDAGHMPGHDEDRGDLGRGARRARAKQALREAPA
jgi:hypothetical protein